MAAAAADLLASLSDTSDSAEGHCGAAEKRMFAPQFIEGATARLLPLPAVARAA
jgi:hypothetical protein